MKLQHDVQIRSDPNGVAILARARAGPVHSADSLLESLFSPPIWVHALFGPRAVRVSRYRTHRQMGFSDVPRLRAFEQIRFGYERLVRAEYIDGWLTVVRDDGERWDVRGGADLARLAEDLDQRMRREGALGPLDADERAARDAVKSVTQELDR